MLYFQVEEDKVEKIYDHLDKSCRYLTKAKQCVEDMMQGGSMGERGGIGYRDGGSAGFRDGGGSAGFRDGGMGYRDEDDDDMIGFRRGVKGTGPYSRLNRRNYSSAYREPYMM